MYRCTELLIHFRLFLKVYKVLVDFCAHLPWNGPREHFSRWMDNWTDCYHSTLGFARSITCLVFSGTTPLPRMNLCNICACQDTRQKCRCLQKYNVGSCLQQILYFFHIALIIQIEIDFAQHNTMLMMMSTHATVIFSCCIIWQEPHFITSIDRNGTKSKPDFWSPKEICYARSNHFKDVQHCQIIEKKIILISTNE